jgi:hypothetical protein
MRRGGRVSQRSGMTPQGRKGMAGTQRRTMCRPRLEPQARASSERAGGAVAAVAMDRSRTSRRLRAGPRDLWPAQRTCGVLKNQTEVLVRLRNLESHRSSDMSKGVGNRQRLWSPFIRRNGRVVRIRFRPL